MTDEKYYKLSLLRKTKSGAEWEKIYFRVYENSELKIIDKSMDNLSKLEEITEKEAKRIINDFEHDFSYG